MRRAAVVADDVLAAENVPIFYIKISIKSKFKKPRTKSLKKSPAPIDGNDIPVPENSGNVLVVTSKAAIAGWGDVVDTVGGHLRVVDYSVSLAKRRGLRISNHSADVVLTTWDVLKSKEVHIRGVECSYCHGQRWASIVVDYHTNRTPSAKNQAGRAIEALKSMVGSKHGSRQAKVRTSLVQIDDGGNSRLDPFLPRISTLGGLKGTLSEAYHDARQPT